ncbi:MAG: hypothetical protein KatS3mg031_0759 [Chitinophagales bacterium]|nr:MAG: hypothetical protein KatS3mg031_0759 [Chitinophagales bacterium]
MSYYLEIGFWYGAMYVAYALSIGIFLIGWAATSLLLPESWSPWIQVGIICACIVFLMPVTYALSRLIWINLFVQYEPGRRELHVNPHPEMTNST